MPGKRIRIDRVNCDLQWLKNQLNSQDVRVMEPSALAKFYLPRLREVVSVMEDIHRCERLSAVGEKWRQFMNDLDVAKHDPVDYVPSMMADIRKASKRQ